MLSLRAGLDVDAERQGRVIEALVAQGLGVDALSMVDRIRRRTPERWSQLPGAALVTLLHMITSQVRALGYCVLS